MLCETCGENEATVHLTQVIDGVVKKLHMCEECAEQSGLNVHGPMSLTDMLFGLGAQQEKEPGEPDKSCVRCGMSRADFKKTSRLGCPACYETFGDELAPFLAAMQKGTQHVGKVPAAEAARNETSDEIAAMQTQLDQAVAAEKYEEAARLRDLIRQEKKKIHAKLDKRKESSESG